MGAFGSTATELSSWRTVWDLRASGSQLYHDILDAYSEAATYLTSRERPIVLVLPEDEADAEQAFRSNMPSELWPKLVPVELRPLATRRLDLAPFEEEWEGMREVPLLDFDVDFDLSLDSLDNDLRRDASTAVQLGVVNDERTAFQIVDDMLRDDEFTDGYMRILDDISLRRRTLLSSFLETIATNSLFSQLALVSEPDRIRVVPLHGHGQQQIETPQGLLTVRPSRTGSAIQWQRFAQAIAELENLLNAPDIDEHAIERHLRANPLFLRGLNYSEVYHQVILPLGDGKSLRPDIFAEPAGEEWAEVIDVKLPSEPIFVGGGHRVRVSTAITEAAAQLREYANYFDDRKLARAIEEKYGFRCYRPRPVVIIGRDPRQGDEQQRRAALSAYPDLQIVTYDHLLQSARERLLF